MEYKIKEKDSTIEKLAWQLFLNKTGIRFKRELTPEEKKSITDMGSYENYREDAKKMYEKKIRSLSNKKYPVIEIPASGNPTWVGGAYCLCFVYSKYDGNFVLRGYVKEVEDYLKKNYTHYFCNKTLWSGGFNRDIWEFWKDNVGIFRPSIRERRKGKKIEVRPYSSWWEDDETIKEKDKMCFNFKRLPKRWIPEFDQL